jgi:hypothetical protein
MLSELADHYLNTKNEIKAVAYMLEKEEGGADCLIDDETIYLQKPAEQYLKPSFKLANLEEDI